MEVPISLFGGNGGEREDVNRFVGCGEVVSCLYLCKFLVVLNICSRQKRYFNVCAMTIAFQLNK